MTPEIKTPEQIKEVREELFRAAALAQTEFWNAMSDLEAELGFEVDSNRDLGETDLETLIVDADEDADEEECPSCFDPMDFSEDNCCKSCKEQYGTDEDPDPLSLRRKP